MPEIDIVGQNRLAKARVAIIGLGGLGSPIAMYLAAAGVGALDLVDDDVVELSNLQRQIIHGTDDLGRLKVESAAQTIAGLNADTVVECHPERATETLLNKLIKRCDAVVDATDNFDTRFMINRVCIALRKPLISGAAIRFEGQVSVYRNDLDDAPCYRCLYGGGNDRAETCAQTGVVAPLLGMIGSVQAMETLKVIMNIGTDLNGRLLLLDAMSMEWQTMRFARDPDCVDCAQKRGAE